jgi:hypothetical protein
MRRNALVVLATMVLCACGRAETTVQETSAVAVPAATGVVTPEAGVTASSTSIADASLTAVPDASTPDATVTAVREQNAPEETPTPNAATPARPRGTIELAPATPVAPQPSAPEGVALPSPLPAPVDALVADARADLAQRSGVSSDDVEVVEVLAVTWPDGALGCPREGMAYPQVQVDGVLVRLRVNGQVFDYHGDGQRPLFLCEGKKGG